MHEHEINTNSITHGIATYLFCRYLEQNKLYDYSYLENAVNFNNKHKENELKRYREIYKVFHRSGAAEVLDMEFDELNITYFLVSENIINKSANDIALINGYWRFTLKKEFGLMDILHEGYYSINEEFYPDKYKLN